MAAIGNAEYVKGSWIKPGAVVIDVGTNGVPDSTKKSGMRWVGDVEYSEAAKVASAITPVPGGVGPMTVAMLMENTWTSAKRWFDLSRERKITPLPLELKTPVPKDIEIAMQQTPKHMEVLLRELGLTPAEVSAENIAATQRLEMTFVLFPSASFMVLLRPRLASMFSSVLSTARMAATSS